MRFIGRNRAAAFGVALAALLGLCAPRESAAGLRLDAWQGHLSAGFAKLFVSENPAGSISMGAGVDYPLAPGWRLGVDLNEHLLGGITAQRGSLFANIDYSLLEIGLRAHWQAEHLGPIHRVSFGPALMDAKAEISSSAGGLGFDDLAVAELAPGFSLDATLIPAKPRPVAIGLELGVRTAFLKDDTWTVLSSRVTFHY